MTATDPPYNTGDDEFGYNDHFNHSTWLTFMKNRLELSKRLLRNDGAIFVQIDHHELGYINVLMDEIFGIENKVQIIAVKTASPAGFKTVNPGPIDVTEYILFYTKNKSAFRFKKGYVPVGYNKNYNLVLTRSENVEDWEFTPIKEAVIRDAGFASEKDAKKQYGDAWKVILNHLIEEYACSMPYSIRRMTCSASAGRATVRIRPISPSVHWQKKKRRCLKMAKASHERQRLFPHHFRANYERLFPLEK